MSCWKGRGEMSKKYYVYKYLDKDGSVLYVGQTINYIDRYKQHSKSSEWFNLHTEYLVHEISSEVDMNIAEIYLINTEYPKYNIRRCYSGSTSSKMVYNNWFSVDEGAVKDDSAVLMSSEVIKSIEKFGYVSIQIIDTLVQHSDSKGVSYLTIEEITKESGYGMTKIAKCIKGLKDANIIKKVDRGYLVDGCHYNKKITEQAVKIALLEKELEQLKEGK